MLIQISQRRHQTGDRNDLITCATFALIGMLTITVWCTANKDMRPSCTGDESGFVTEADIGFSCR